MTVVACVLLALAARPFLAGWLDPPALTAWATVLVAIVVQAIPFLVLGVAVSGAVAAFVPARALTRALPRRPALAVPAAAVAGAALPGCECGSIPIARRLIARGVAPGAALTFLLSAPAINPVVLVSTAVAFPGRPMMVLARLLAGLAASIAVGLVWTALRRDHLLARVRRPVPEGGAPSAVFLTTARHDLLDAGGFLVIGAAAAAALQTVVPRSVLDAFTQPGWLAVLALAVLAVLLSICSEADAFLVAGLGQFSPTAQLAFLVVGPMIDLKLGALQAGTFGWRFVLVFAPLTFGAALLAATSVGSVLL